MKKTTVVIAVLLVVASLSIGINIGLILNQGILTQSPQVTSTPIPTSLSTKMVIAYSEISKTTIGDNTSIVLSVNATLTNGDLVSLDFNYFALSVYIPRGGVPSPAFEMKYVTVEPKESGAITVENGDNRTVTFQLTFEFPTKGKNFDDNLVSFSSYQLGYGKSPPSSIEWVNTCS